MSLVIVGELLLNPYKYMHYGHWTLIMKAKVDANMLLNDETQQLISNDTTLEVEHIFSRQRQINEKTLSNKNNLESIGNKALLEKGINIRASDYRFEDKKSTI